MNQFPNRPNTGMFFCSGGLQARRGQKKFQLIFDVLEKVYLYIAFPAAGGVRLYGCEPGMFEPEGLLDICYEEQGDGSLRLSGPDAQVVVSFGQNSWALDFCAADGSARTRITSDRFFMGYDRRRACRSVYLQLPIHPDEVFWGFGERFNGLAQKNIQLMMWNVDCGAGYPLPDFKDACCQKNQAYKNVPLIHSTEGYSLFFNSFYPISFDIGRSNPHWLGTEIYGVQPDIYFFMGQAQENLHSYLKLTGKPVLPPKWAFDYWMGGGWNVWNLPNESCAAENIERALDRYEEMGVSIRQAYLEINADERIFDLLKKRGVRPLMWTDSRLLPAWHGADRYENRYLVHRQDEPDSPMEYNYVDFTSKRSQDALSEKFHWVWEHGLKGMMVDFADSMPEDSLCANGKTGLEMHNGYAYWYGRRMNESFYEQMGDDFILFQRSGCAGSQHYTASFGGDMPVSFLGLRRSVWGGLSAASSGFCFWGSDLGGYGSTGNGEPEEEIDHLDLYRRWLQFSTFSPLMRSHGHSDHAPWVYGPEAEENFRYYYAMRQSMMDKIYSTAVRCSVEGDTMMKPMAAAFHLSPELDSQYLFCDDYLVCPVTEQGRTSALVVFPEDGWTDLYTGERHGAGEAVLPAPPDRIPVFIRAGAVIPARIHEESALPALDLERMRQALLLTPPLAKRETRIYPSPKESTAFCSEPCPGGFMVTAGGPCGYNTILLYGKWEAETEEGGGLSCYAPAPHMTAVRLARGWRKLRLWEVGQ